MPHFPGQTFSRPPGTLKDAGGRFWASGHWLFLKTTGLPRALVICGWLRLENKGCQGKG